MKSHVLVFILMFVFFYVNAEAATVTDTLKVKISCDQSCEDEGLTILGYQGEIQQTLQKVVNFVRSNGNNTTLNFSLDKGASVTLNEGNTTGDWFSTGAYYDSPPSDGALYRVLRKDLTKQLNLDIKTVIQIYVGTSVPSDTNAPKIVSSNSSIISCNGLVCTGQNPGTAQITVSFPNSVQTSNNTILGTKQGFGKIHFKGKSETVYPDGQKNTAFINSTPVTKTYSFPSVVYTVTVNPLPNSPHAVSYAGADNIVDTGARIKWTYSDADNDLQTNYQVQIATDSSFTNIVKVASSPGGNVSSVRNVTITGLQKSTTYYARTRAYNNVNFWSTYQTGTFVTTGTLDAPAVSCSATPSSINVGESTNFSIVTQDAVSPITYEWLRGGLQVGTNSNLNQTYGANGQASRNEYVTINITDSNGSTASDSCYVVVLDDEIVPEEPEVPEVPDIVISQFEFNPNIVASGGFCKLTLEAENVSSCVLLRNGIVPSISPIIGPIISTVGEYNIPVGNHTLACSDLSDTPVQYVFNSKRCITNPEIGEY